MCLAASCSTQQPLGQWAMRWQLIARFPARLFVLSSFFHVILLTLLTLIFNVSMATSWLGFIALFGIVSFSLLGILIEFLPRWGGQSEIQYGRYFMIFLLQFSGLLLMELGMFTHVILHYSGLSLLLLSWVLALQSLNWVYQWSDFKQATALHNSRYMMWVLMLIMLASIIANITSNQAPNQFILWSVIFLNSLLALVLGRQFTRLEFKKVYPQ